MPSLIGLLAIISTKGAFKMTNSTRPTFSLTDLTTIAAWCAARPLGLRGDVTGDHQAFGDVLEVFRSDPTLPLYFVAPLRSGGFEVSPGDHRRRAFRATVSGANQVAGVAVADIAAALTLVAQVERQTHPH